MRIGFIGNIPPPIGGAEVFLREFLDHLMQRGHKGSALVRWRTQIFMYFPEELTRVYAAPQTVKRECGIPVYYMLEALRRRPREKHQSYYSRVAQEYPLQSLRAAEVFAEHRIELIHCHMVFPNLLIAGLAAQALSIPLVLTVHGLLEFRILDFVRSHCAMLADQVEAFFPKAACVVGVSDEIARECRRRGASKVIHMGGGIDTKVFAPLAKREVPGRDIVFVGSVREDKGACVLIQAFEHLDGDIKGNLVFLGRQLLEGPVVKRALRNPRIHFLGEQGADKVREIIRGAKMLVLPSRSEGMPMSILEAMALEKPVLVSKIGGLKGLIQDGKNGFFINQRTPSALARNIHSVAGRTDLKVVGERARRTACRFDIRRIVSRYESFYRSVLT